MNTKHTPGPYRAIKHPWAGTSLVEVRIHGPNDELLATIGPVNEEGNAPLFAAAPELLAALKHCAGVIHAIRTGNVPPALIPHIDSERLAESAIAKATGNA